MPAVDEGNFVRRSERRRVPGGPGGELAGARRVRPGLRMELEKVAMVDIRGTAERGEDFHPDGWLDALGKERGADGGNSFQQVGGAAGLGDIALDGHEAGKPPVRIEQRLALDVNEVGAAVLGVVGGLDVEASARADALAHEASGGVLEVGTLEQGARGLPQDFLRGVTAQSGETVIHPLDETGGVGDDHAAVRTLGDEGEAVRLGAAADEGQLGALGGGEIQHGEDGSAIVVGFGKRSAERLHRNFCAIQARQCGLVAAAGQDFVVVGVVRTGEE